MRCREKRVNLIADAPQAPPDQGCGHGPPSTTLWVPKMQSNGCPVVCALVPSSDQALNKKRSFILNAAVLLTYHSPSVQEWVSSGCHPLCHPPPVSHPHCSSPCPSIKAVSVQVSLVQGWVLSQSQLLLPNLTGFKQQAQWQTRHVPLCKTTPYYRNYNVLLGPGGPY